MGYTPREVGEMSLWEYTACADGYSRANGGNPSPRAPTEEEFVKWTEGER